MLSIKNLLTCALVILAWTAGETVSAITKDDFIDTNRPSFCQSALVVPQGSVQLENGGLYQHFQHGFSYFEVPENEVRVGLLKKTEFQVLTPMFATLDGNSDKISGATDLSEIGLKQQVGPYKNFVASFVGSLSVPTGRSEFGSTGVRPQFRVPYAYALNEKLTIAGMQSLTVNDSGRSASYQPFVMVTRAFGKDLKTVAFVEYAGFFNKHAPSLQIAHFGGYHKIKRHHQIDIHFGFGLDKSSPAAFVGTGYSYRFDGLPFGN